MVAKNLQLNLFDLKVEPIKPKVQVKPSFDIMAYANRWQPKTKFLKLPLEEVQEKTPHGWLLKYLYGVDLATNKRWDFWIKANQVKPKWYFHLSQHGLTDDFLENTLYCHKMPIVEFSESSKVLTYWYSIIEMLTRSGVSLINAVEYLLDWFLYGFGHENFTERPKLNARENFEINLYQYIDLFPLLYYPADYFSKIMAEVFPLKQNQRTGFFPTPDTICKFMVRINGSISDRPNIQTMNEPACGTGTMVLEYSNTGGMCVTTVELQQVLVKAFLVNCYLYCPQYARPIWYLLQNNSIVWGDSLTVECFVNYHEKYAQGILKEFI